MNKLIKFDFQGKQVRVVTVDDHEEWVAKDVCEVLEIDNPRSSLALLDDDEKGVHTVDTLGGPQEMATITEPGLYKFMLRSRKPQAKTFSRWVTHEILPKLRRDGYYVAPGMEQKAIAELHALLAESVGQNQQLAGTVAALTDTVLELRDQVTAMDRAHPFGMMANDAKVLRGQITGVARMRTRLGDPRSLLELYSEADTEIRDAVGYPRRAGSRWESCPVELAARAFSLVSRMSAKLERALLKREKRQAAIDAQQKLFGTN